MLLLRVFPFFFALLFYRQIKKFDESFLYIKRFKYFCFENVQNMGFGLVEGVFALFKGVYRNNKKINENIKMGSHKRKCV